MQFAGLRGVAEVFKSWCRGEMEDVLTIGTYTERIFILADTN